MAIVPELGAPIVHRSGGEWAWGGGGGGVEMHRANGDAVIKSGLTCTDKDGAFWGKVCSRPTSAVQATQVCRCTRGGRLAGQRCEQALSSAGAPSRRSTRARRACHQLAWTRDSGVAAGQRAGQSAGAVLTSRSPPHMPPDCAARRKSTICGGWGTTRGKRSSRDQPVLLEADMSAPLRAPHRSAPLRSEFPWAPRAAAASRGRAIWWVPSTLPAASVVRSADESNSLHARQGRLG